MPDRPDDPTPPPKVLPKDEPRHYESVTESPHEMYMGRVSPKCDDGKVIVPVQIIFDEEMLKKKMLK